MKAQLTSPAVDDDRQVDLWRVAEALWRKRLWLVGCCVVFVVLFGAVAFLTKPVYRATTVVVDASAERTGLGAMSAALGQFGGLASLAGINVGGPGGASAEPLAVLRSREFTEAFIRDRNLLPVLYEKQWDAKSGKWKVAHEDSPTLARAFRMFDKGVRKITEDRRNGLIKIEVEWTDPALAADWANTLVARVNAEMRVRAIDRASAAVGYLEKELTVTSELETRQAISRLMETQIKQRMLANVTMEYAFRVVDRALPPDRRDKVRPKRMLMLLTGGVLGFVFGVFTALIVDSYKLRRNSL